MLSDILDRFHIKHFEICSLVQKLDLRQTSRSQIRILDQIKCLLSFFIGHPGAVGHCTIEKLGKFCAVYMYYTFKSVQSIQSKTSFKYQGPWFNPPSPQTVFRFETFKGTPWDRRTLHHWIPWKILSSFHIKHFEICPLVQKLELRQTSRSQVRISDQIRFWS